MTDYLEELLRGSGQALEEARRRLEELLSPLQPTNSSETKDGKWISFSGDPQSAGGNIT